MSKILHAAAFATGYVLGTRAGRERYEQIVRTAGRLREDAPDLASQVRDQAAEVRERVTGDDEAGPGSGGSGGSGAGGPAPSYSATNPPPSPPQPSGGPGTKPVPPEGHTDVEEELVFSSGPDVEAPIEEIAEGDPR